MRDFLTVLAVALIAILVVALAGPHFIDWSSQRGRIDAALGEALGYEVRTRGAVSLRLLPSPVLQLEGAEVRDAPPPAAAGDARNAPGAAPPLLTTGNLRVELALAPLLGGKWQIADAVVDRPALRLVWPPASDARRPGPAIAPALDALRISNGVLTIVDRRGALLFQRQGISAQVQAAALAGPWRINGEADGIPFSLATGELERDGALRLRAWLGENQGGRVEFDGRALWPDAASGREWGLAGRLSLSRLLQQGAAEIGPEDASRASLTADISLAGEALDASQIRIDIGNPLAPVRLEGSGAGALGGAGNLALDLKARRLDLAGLHGADGDDVFASVMAVVEELARLAPLPMLSARLSIDALAWGEEETGPAQLEARLADGVLTFSNGRVALPGAALELAGDARVAPRPFITLSPHLEAGQPALLAAWLRRLGAPGDLAGWVGRQKSLTLSGQAGASRESLSVHGLKLTVADGELSGLFASRAGDLRAPPRFDAQFAARGLDLADLPLAQGLLAGWSGDAGARQPEGSLTFTGERLRLGATGPVGAVRLRASRAGADVDVALLDVRNLGGVDMTAAGSLSGAGKPLAGAIRAPGLASLAALADRLGVGGPAWLQRALRNPALARPVQISFGAEPQPGGGALFRFNGDVTSAGVVMGRLALAPPAPGRAVSLSGGQITLSGGNAATPLRLLAPAGFALADPPAGQGAWRVVVNLRPDNGAVRAAVEAQAAGARLTITPDAGGARLALATDDAASFARSLGWPRPAAAPLKLEGRFNWGHAGQGQERGPGWSLAFQGRSGDAPLSGRLSPLGDSATGDSGLAAQLNLETLSLPALAGALALGEAAPDAPQGDGPWSSRRFAPAPVSLTDPATGAPRAMELSLKARRLDLGAGFVVADASLGVASVVDGVRMALQPAALSTPLSTSGAASTPASAGGRLAGTLLLRRQGAAAAVAADLRLTGAPLAGWGVGQVKGVADVDLRLGASGESPAALVANLAGNGEVRLRDGQLPQAAPTAPGAVVESLAGDPAGLDAARLLQTTQRELARASFRVAEAKAPIVAAGGIIRIDPPPLADGAGSLDAEVTVDLRTLRLDAVARLVAPTAPPRWKGAPPALVLHWRGPLMQPTRTVDVAALQTGLAAIRLDDELRRVEAWKAEARRLEEAERRRRQESDAQKESSAQKASDAQKESDLQKERAAQEERQADEARQEDARPRSGAGAAKDAPAPAAPLPPPRPALAPARPQAQPKPPAALPFTPTPTPRFQ